MTPARNTRITAIDFEGTGAVKGWPDEPWQIGLVTLHEGRVVAESAFECLLQIGDRPFNRYAPGRHAERRAQMKTAMTLPALWPTLRPHLEGTVLAAHNVATEMRYLTTAFPLHPPRIEFDTLKLVRRIYPALHCYRLEGLLERLCLTPRVQQLAPGREPHDALYDAIGCAVLLEHVLTLPGWGDSSVEMLVQSQTPKRRQF